jgi:hypothetical protein
MLFRALELASADGFGDVGIQTQIPRFIHDDGTRESIFEIPGNGIMIQRGSEKAGFDSALNVVIRFELPLLVHCDLKQKWS